MKIITRLLALAFTGLFLVASCNKKDKCPSQSATKEELQGHWQQPPSNSTGLNFAGNEYEYFFDQDSFKMIRYHFDDVIHDEHGCYNLSFYEYAKGVYNIVGDSVYFDGVFTQSDYSKKDSGCYHIGAYNEKFRLQKQCDILNMGAYDSFTMNKQK